MKTYLIAIIIALTSSQAFAEYVNGYYRSNGTYVQGYDRSSANSTVTDNYSYRGNVNPSTGQIGNNNYIHDTTSPFYRGADDNGNYGHDPFGN